MLDPAVRKQEASKAKQIKDSKAKELEAKLSLYRAKGDELSEKDLKRLVKVFGAFGFTADEIKKKFGTGGKKQEKIDPSEVLDKTQARNVQNFMQQLDMKEKTLYDFLGLAPTSSCNQLCEAADSMKKKILAKGDKTGRDNAVQSLCGLCVVIFKDAASKRKYDNYVNLTKYRAVNEAVDELALSNQKRIEPKMKESLIDIAVGQYHVIKSYVVCVAQKTLLVQQTVSNAVNLLLFRAPLVLLKTTTLLKSVPSVDLTSQRWIRLLSCCVKQNKSTLKRHWKKQNVL